MLIKRISPDMWSVTVEPNEMGLTATTSWPHQSLIGFINKRGTLRVSRPAGGAPRIWGQVAKIKLEDARRQLVRVGDLVLSAHVKAQKEEERTGNNIVRLSDGRSRRFHGARSEETYRGFVEGMYDWAEKELAKMPSGSKALFFKSSGKWADEPFGGLVKDEYGHIKTANLHVSGSPTRGHKAGLKFVVRGKSGKVAGRYATKAEAERRVAQLQAGAARLRSFAFGRGTAHSWPGQPRRHAKAAKKGHRRSSRSPGSRWEVIVGNVGTVFDGTRESAARVVYKDYVIKSKSNNGRAGGESVTLMRDGEPVVEHIGYNDEG